MSKNFIQHWEGFPDVDYEWGRADNFQGFVNTTPVEEYTNVTGTCKKANDTVMVNEAGNDITITMSQALMRGDVQCEDICEEDKEILGCDKKKLNKKKVGSWITNFLAGTGLYRPIPVYNPNAPQQSTSGYVGGALYGCTNPRAINYNPMANTDDGSCQEDKGLSPLAWAGIGVGAILLIIGVVALTSGKGGKSSSRRRSTRRRRKTSYGRKPTQKVVVNLED